MSKYNLNNPWEQILAEIERVAAQRGANLASSMVIEAFKEVFNALPKELYSEAVFDGIIATGFEAVRTGFSAHSLETYEANLGISAAETVIRGLSFRKGVEEDEQKVQDLQQQIDAKEDERCEFVAKINLGVNVQVQQATTKACLNYVKTIVNGSEAAQLTEKAAALIITTAAARAEADSSANEVKEDAPSSPVAGAGEADSCAFNAVPVDLAAQPSPLAALDGMSG